MSVYQEGDLVWVQDYHLMLVPEMLRELEKDDRMMQLECVASPMCHCDPLATLARIAATSPHQSSSARGPKPYMKKSTGTPKPLATAWTVPKSYLRAAFARRVCE